MSNKKNLQEDRIIQEVMENFNWEKCNIVMNLIDWRWFSNTVPEIYELKATALNLINHSIKGVKSNDVHHNSSYYSATGGLKATSWKNRYGQLIAVKLEFVLTDWESDGDYYDDDLQN